MGSGKLEEVASYCYLDGMLSPGGGCELAVTTSVKVQRATTSSHIPHPSYKTRGLVSALACGVKLGH